MRERSSFISDQSSCSISLRRSPVKPEMAPPHKVPCLVLTRFIGRGLCSLDIVARRNGSRSGPLATIDALFLTGRKGSLGRSIDVWRDWTDFRFNAGRYGFAAIDVQLDPRRKGSLRRSIDVWRDWIDFRFNAGRYRFAAIDI